MRFTREYLKSNNLLFYTNPLTHNPRCLSMLGNHAAAEKWFAFGNKKSVVQLQEKSINLKKIIPTSWIYIPIIMWTREYRWASSILVTSQQSLLCEILEATMLGVADRWARVWRMPAWVQPSLQGSHQWILANHLNHEPVSLRQPCHFLLIQWRAWLNHL